MSAQALPTRDDWRDLKSRCDALPDAARRAIAQHWTRAAQMEHASVAAFSRFSLQLLAVGAPPSLLEDAHRAALDEDLLHCGRLVGPDGRAGRRSDLPVMPEVPA